MLVVRPGFPAGRLGKTVRDGYMRRTRSFLRRAAKESPEMSTFDKREEGFEKKYAHDEALQFKANARRNKWLGLWAAEKMGMTGEAAETYAKSIVAADVEETGEEDVFRKVR